MYLVIGYVLLSSIPTLVLWAYARSVWQHNEPKKRAVLKELGVPSSETRKLVGFFHPYCNAGGGGERVLWTAVALLQRTSPEMVSVVYSGDVDASKEEIIRKVEDRFNILLDPKSLHFVFLFSRRVVEDSSWPRFTLLGQSLGSMYLAWEAMTKLIPDIYIDTMGYAFTFYVVRWLSLGKVPTGAYVHYPTISMNMIARVKTRQAGHTNSVASSATLSSGKLIYYRIFMYLYACALGRTNFLMANSSWTKNHVDGILSHRDPLLGLASVIAGLLVPISLFGLFGEQVNSPTSAKTVYPACETEGLVDFPLEGRERIILSVAQFRPEKDHIAQIKAFHTLIQQYPEYTSGQSNAVKLILVGGVRNNGDAARVESLRSLAKDLGLTNQVDFIVNAAYSDILGYLARASAGLSTMVDEHFGINVVEFMAAGVIPVTHASGGPLNDIVVPYRGEQTGFHASSSIGFAEHLHEVLSMAPEAQLAMRGRARAWAVHQFSREGFEREWEACGWREFIR